MKLNKPCAKAWTNHPQPRRLMNNTNHSDYHIIEHGIAIVLALTISLINNLTCLYFSILTPNTKLMADPKREVGFSKSARRSSQSSTRTKTTTRGATNKTGTSSAKSPRKPRTRTPKDVSPSPSRTAQEVTPSCPDQMSQQTIECLTTSTPASKTTSRKTTRKRNLPIANA